MNTTPAQDDLNDCEHYIAKAFDAYRQGKYVSASHWAANAQQIARRRGWRITNDGHIERPGRSR